MLKDHDRKQLWEQEPDEFNLPLMEHLIWYNTEKVHRGIGKKAPLRYYLDKFITDPEKFNMHWMLTNIIVIECTKPETICAQCRLFKSG